MNFPAIAILSVVLLPVALALVWFHRFTVSYRPQNLESGLDETMVDSVTVPSHARYEPPKSARLRDYAVSMLSEAGF